ncbi:MAG: hypothetical protein ACPLW7_00235 [Minisyncoccia bacterium]|jgi:hypothetical protein
MNIEDEINLLLEKVNKKQISVNNFEKELTEIIKRYLKEVDEID